MENNKTKKMLDKKLSNNEQENQDREFKRLEKLAAAINALNEQKPAANKFTPIIHAKEDDILSLH